MLITVLRGVAGIVIGLVAAFVIVATTNSASHAIYPVAAHIDAGDPAAMKALIASMPLGALITLVVGWVVGAYVAAVIALMVAERRRWAGLTAAGLFLLVVLANLLMLPHPLWMIVAGLAGVIAAGWAADRLFARKKAT